MILAYGWYSKSCSEMLLVLDAAKMQDADTIPFKCDSTYGELLKALVTEELNVLLFENALAIYK